VIYLLFDLFKLNTSELSEKDKFLKKIKKREITKGRFGWLDFR